MWWVICWSQYWGCWREGKTSKVIGLILWTCVELPLVHGLPQNYAGNNFQRNWKEKILDPKFYHCFISKVNLAWNARDTTYFFLNLSQWESYAGSYGVTITFTPHQTPPIQLHPKTYREEGLGASWHQTKPSGILLRGENWPMLSEPLVSKYRIFPTMVWQGAGNIHLCSHLPK